MQRMSDISRAERQALRLAKRKAKRQKKLAAQQFKGSKTQCHAMT